MGELLALAAVVARGIKADRASPVLFNDGLGLLSGGHAVLPGAEIAQGTGPKLLDGLLLSSQNPRPEDEKGTENSQAQY